MARKIKILHVLHAFAPGGLENGIVNLINNSPSHLVHELCLLSRGGEFLNRLSPAVVYHELNKRSGNDMRMIFRLRQLFSRYEYDIVHTRNWAGFDGVVASCLTSRHAVIHGEHGRNMDDPAGLKFRRNLARRALAPRIKKLVAVSKDLYDWLQSTVRIPERKLVFIPNGVDTERFKAGREIPLRKELGIGDDEFVVGTISRLDPIKNHAGLINAVRLANKSGHKIRLVIVGDGPERRNVETGIRASGFAPEPRLLGYRADVERLYRTFDAFVLNSFGEGMSNTLLEAMASGLPVVCTAVGGNLELIADRERGMLVRPGDDAGLAAALGEYASTPGIRAQHAANARRFIVDQFSLEQMVKRYVSLYEAVA